VRHAGLGVGHAANELLSAVASTGRCCSSFKASSNERETFPREARVDLLDDEAPLEDDDDDAATGGSASGGRCASTSVMPPRGTMSFAG